MEPRRYRGCIGEHSTTGNTFFLLEFLFSAFLTLSEEIDHRRHLDFINQGNPPTLDLWYPPRGLSIGQHRLEIRAAHRTRAVTTLLDHRDGRQGRESPNKHYFSSCRQWHRYRLSIA